MLRAKIVSFVRRELMNDSYIYFSGVSVCDFSQCLCWSLNLEWNADLDIMNVFLMEEGDIDLNVSRRFLLLDVGLYGTTETNA
jgi:hypothetical protein